MLRFRELAFIVGAAVFLKAASYADGGEITSALQVSASLGRDGQYQIQADNGPTSFDAKNLPAGMSLDHSTGRITGAPSISGAWPVELLAHGPAGDAKATCIFSVYTDIPVSDFSLSALTVDPASLLIDPHRPRIYCGGYDGLNIIDTETKTVLKSFPNQSLVGTVLDQAISPDGHTLWIARSTNDSIASLDLDTLDHLVELPISGSVFGLRMGYGNRLYLAMAGGEILQVDPSTGSIENRIDPNTETQRLDTSSIATTPDGKTLFVSYSYLLGDSLVPHAACCRYDISGATPLLQQRVDIPAPRIQDVTVSPDGQSLYLVLGSFDLTGTPTPHQTLCLAGNDLTQTKGILSTPGTPTQGLQLSADGLKAALPIAHLSQDNHTMSGLVSIFDTSTFELIDTIVLGSNTSFSMGQYFVGQAALNDASSEIFVIDGAYPHLKVFGLHPASPSLPPPEKHLLNISTRLLTRDNDNVLIAGFIIRGDAPKRVLLRGRGPSLPVPGVLSDPVLELHGPDGALVEESDDWWIHALDIIPTRLPPSQNTESAIIANLLPGNYTAILRGFEHSEGVALVEVFDLNPTSGSELANISSRGKVETGDNVMIGGFIVGGQPSPVETVVRALGPSLTERGVSGVLPDPMLEIHDGQGVLLAENDDWQTATDPDLVASGLTPGDFGESALSLSLRPGNYTAIVRGSHGSTGVALVEVYNLH